MNARHTNTESLAERARQDFERPDRHTFRVGETYENRLGKYEVLQIAPPKMTIRYEDGGVVTADIVILARIWENMQLPPERPEPEGRGQAAARPAAQPRAARTPARFQGLSARDFGPGATRATWRGPMGALLATRLNEITGIAHKAFPVGTRPELYIGREHHFNGRFSEHRAKFLFRLTADAAEYGFYVERDSQKMDLTWDWRRFIAALKEPHSWAVQVEAAMRERGLEAEAHASEGQLPPMEQKPGRIGGWTATAEGLAWWPEGASEPTPCTWQEMADVLTGVETRLKCGFYLLGRTPKEEAVASSEQLVEQVAQTCAALMPLYSASAR